MTIRRELRSLRRELSCIRQDMELLRADVRRLRADKADRIVGQMQQAAREMLTMCHGRD